MPRPKLAALGLAALLALAACGTTDNVDDDAADDGDAAESPDEGESPGAAISDSCAEDDTETSTDPVTLTDDLGRTVELDAPAQRVAVLEWQQIEDVLTLCVAPVAVADVEGYETWNSAEELPDDVVDVGIRGEPNLDALLQADPDLVIIEPAAADDPLIAQLEEAGVTVLASVGADAADPIGHMQDTFNLIAEAVGREERAEVVLGEFEASLAAGQEALADEAGTTFAYFDAWIDGANVSIRPFGQGSLVGEIGEELGLENVWTGEVDEVYGLGVTDLEGITAIGDATIFHTGTDDDEILDMLGENPLWAAIPAVAEDRVFAFPEHIWTFGGPRSSQQVIDAYVSLLTA